MKKLITLLEISSSEFRTKIKDLGFTEKGSELTSGGELNSGLLDIVAELVAEWKTSNPNCPLNFTSGNDTFHKGITDYVSRHTKGEAMDVTLPDSCHSLFKTLLDTYKSKYNGFSYIDEYTNPTSKATAGHFHMSYRANDPEGSGNSASSTSTSASTSASTSTPTQTSSAPGEFDTIAQNIQNGVLGSLTKASGMNESISLKEQRLIKNIEKIKKLL
jgi:hypothetical protein